MSSLTRFFVLAVLGGLRPHLPAGGALGKPGFPRPLRTGCALTFPRVGLWGNPVSPDPCARAAPSPSRGWGSGETRFPQTPAHGLRPHLPAGGALGKHPVSPDPCARAAPSPSRGWGSGETRFPQTPAHGLRPHLPAGGALGKPGFPRPLRTGCALTFPRVGLWGNPVSPDPCSSGNTKVPAPSPALARWGRESGSSPQRGEVGRGAERYESTLSRDCSSATAPRATRRLVTWIER